MVIMKNGNYIAMIGDIVASREMPDSERRALQQRFTDYFGSINSDLDPGVASSPLVTLGDEFQVLFQAESKGVRCLLDFIPKVLELASPQDVRFGLGIGRLTTVLQPRALGMDGPCFHRARKALDASRTSDLLCRLDTGGGTWDLMWSTLASYAVRQRLDWTEPQREAIEHYEKLSAWNAVAALLDISKGAVSHRKKAAGWNLYQAAWLAMEEGLMHAIIETASGKPWETGS